MIVTIHQIEPKYRPHSSCKFTSLIMRHAFEHTLDRQCTLQLTYCCLIDAMSACSHQPLQIAVRLILFFFLGDNFQAGHTSQRWPGFVLPTRMVPCMAEAKLLTQSLINCKTCGRERLFCEMFRFMLTAAAITNQHLYSSTLVHIHSLKVMHPGPKGIFITEGVRCSISNPLRGCTSHIHLT